MRHCHTHPRFGALYLTPGEFQAAWQQHRNGATDAAMADALPTGIYARNQYIRILADWPDRQAFLQARGLTDQLNRETLFVDAIQEIVDAQP